MRTSIMSTSVISQSFFEIITRVSTIGHRRQHAGKRRPSASASALAASGRLPWAHGDGKKACGSSDRTKAEIGIRIVLGGNRILLAGAPLATVDGEMESEILVRIMQLCIEN
jgi:hypothetical protein